MGALRRLAPACIAPCWGVLLALGGCTLNPPRFAPAETDGLPARAELTQVPFFPQQKYQCGPAALATVLQSSGAAAAPEELVTEVYLPGRKGSLQVELIAAARIRDRVAYPISQDLPSLLRQLAAGTPVLVMQNLGVKPVPLWHYAVFVGYDLEAGTLVLRSGTRQRRVVGMRRFMSTWNRAQRWGLVVIEPDRLPAGAQPERYVAAAAGLEAVGRLDAAKQAYVRAREQWPDSVWPQLGLANLSYRRGDLQAAEGGYLAALALDPRNVVAHNNLAEILSDRGCASQARAHVDRAAALAKGTPLEAAVATTAQHVANAAASGAAASCSSQE
jgi:tetratricopeptide (TPR) repeat protein